MLGASSRRRQTSRVSASKWPAARHVNHPGRMRSARRRRAVCQLVFLVSFFLAVALVWTTMPRAVNPSQARPLQFLKNLDVGKISFRESNGNAQAPLGHKETPLRALQNEAYYGLHQSVEVEWDAEASPKICNGKLFFVAVIESDDLPIESDVIKTIVIRSDALQHDVPQEALLLKCCERCAEYLACNAFVYHQDACTLRLTKSTSRPIHQNSNSIQKSLGVGLRSSTSEEFGKYVESKNGNNDDEVFDDYDDDTGLENENESNGGGNKKGESSFDDEDTAYNEEYADTSSVVTESKSSSDIQNQGGSESMQSTSLVGDINKAEHDARDTNRDGQVSLEEEFSSAAGMSLPHFVSEGGGSIDGTQDGDMLLPFSSKSHESNDPLRSILKMDQAKSAQAFLQEHLSENQQHLFTGEHMGGKDVAFDFVEPGAVNGNGEGREGGEGVGGQGNGDVTSSKESPASKEDLQTLTTTGLEAMLPPGDYLRQLGPFYAKNQKFFGRFRPVQSLFTLMDELVEEHNGGPFDVESVVIGRSAEGRSIRSLEFGNSNRGRHVVIVGGLRGCDWTGPLAILHTAFAILGRAKRTTTQLLDNVRFHLVPLSNPDGYMYSRRKTPSAARHWCKNRRLVLNSHGVALEHNWGVPQVSWGFGKEGKDGVRRDDYQGPSAFSEPEVKALRNMISYYSTGRGRVSVIHVRCCSGIVSPPQIYTDDERVRAQTFKDAANSQNVAGSEDVDSEQMASGETANSVKPRVNLDQLMKALTKVLKSADGTDYVVKPRMNTFGSAHAGQMIDWLYNEVNVEHAYSMEIKASGLATHKDRYQITPELFAQAAREMELASVFAAQHLLKLPLEGKRQEPAVFRSKRPNLSSSSSSSSSSLSAVAVAVTAISKGGSSTASAEGGSLQHHHSAAAKDVVLNKKKNNKH